MESDQPIPPTARIRRYVDDLVTRWPDITTEAARAGDEHPPLRPLHRSSIGSTSPVCVASLSEHHPLRNGLRPRGRRTRPFCNEIIAVATGSPTVDVVFRYVRTGHAGPADDGGQCAETAENQEHLGVTAEQAG